MKYWLYDYGEWTEYDPWHPLVELEYLIVEKTKRKGDIWIDKTTPTPIPNLMYIKYPHQEEKRLVYRDRFVRSETKPTDYPESVDFHKVLRPLTSE